MIALAESRMLREVHLFSSTGSIAGSDGKMSGPERQSRLSGGAAAGDAEVVPGGDFDARDLVRFILACHPGGILATMLFL
jgi:hypothetical protein